MSLPSFTVSMHSPHRLARAALLALAALFSACRATPREASIAVRNHEVEFSATVNGPAFDHGLVMPGYHAVVWKGGRAAGFALLSADVSDRAVISALESAGGRPGNNVPMEAWEHRHDPKAPAADTVIAGSEVEVLLRIPGRTALVPLAAVLEDSGGRGLAMRFGGNAANIPHWKSGCIVCLYSCPGSKVGNARYTERDYASEATRFRVRPGSLPPPGTRVGVVLRLAGVPQARSAGDPMQGTGYRGDTPLHTRSMKRSDL